MRSLNGWRRIATYDLNLFRGRPRLAVAVLGASLLPSLYSTIYLGSTWDPYARLDHLPVGLVMLDEGAESRGEAVNVGEAVAEELLDAHTFAWRVFDDEQAVRTAVRDGTLAFAVVVPADFSARAVPGHREALASLDVVYSEGNTYLGSNIARRFAGELTRQTNQSLGERRWESVLEAAGDAAGGLEELRDGVAKLEAGASQLKDGLGEAQVGTNQLLGGLQRADAGTHTLALGAGTLDTHVGSLTAGVDQLKDGLEQMNDALPEDSVLDQLAVGAVSLADGTTQLGGGLKQLEDGAGQLKSGAGRLPVGRKAVQNGAGRLQAGLGEARLGAERLDDGAKRLSDGVGQLTSGVTRMHDGVRTMVTKLPETERLEELADGAHRLSDGATTLHSGLGALVDGSSRLDGGLLELHEGAGRLHEGLTTLAARLPAAPILEGDPEGLAMSVDSNLVELSSVSSYGAALTPYFMALSLWVGAVVSTFIFPLRVLPKVEQGTSRLAQVLGASAVPLGLMAAQATLLSLAVPFVLGASVPSLLTLWFICLMASATYFFIVLALMRAFGDPGKALALLLLIFQMASSGGIFPIELAPGVYRTAHAFMPFTWVIRALRGAMLGGFDGTWFLPTLTVMGFGLLALTSAVAIGRWHWVEVEAYQPLLDVG